MSKKIKTLQDALSYQLLGLLYSEKKVSEEFNNCSHHVTSSDVKTVIKNYVDNAENVTLKLERIFGYLMLDPVPRKNEVINKMIDETQYLLTYATSPDLKDILMISCMKNINAYKTASYQSCYLMAVELELDAAADLLQEILTWETATGKSLGTISISAFNTINTSAKSREATMPHEVVKE